jgi:multiple antibiotic resistance protein
MDLAGSFVVAFSALFVVVDPIGVAPTFLSLVAGRPDDEVRRIALRASVAGALVLTAFTLGGGLVLELLHVHLDAFRAAGGLLLLLTALDLLRGKGATCRCSPEELAAGAARDDVAIVPLAVPLLAGPGSMATAMVLVAGGEPVQTGIVLVSIALTFGIGFLALRAAASLQAWTHPSLVAVFQRVLGLLLAAISIQFIADGIVGLGLAG